MPPQKINPGPVEGLTCQGSGTHGIHDFDHAEFNLSVGRRTKTYLQMARLVADVSSA
ncbi:hypothetical protein SAMN04488078_102073 [Antarctobacter heliothermus]|uniref:Uncharacterized protein n=1 Tax=Antarctobacter heliothermus TaxID=74033 RepID=A0A239FLW1_9RHOB|nr:hypothetical protein SAMN04488078_102073 [Antarctobacter heliothermus]